MTRRYSGPARRPGEPLSAYLSRRRREAMELQQLTARLGLPAREPRARLSIAEVERLAAGAGDVWPATWLRRACRTLRKRHGYGDNTYIDLTLATAISLHEAASGHPALPGLGTSGAIDDMEVCG